MSSPYQPWKKTIADATIMTTTNTANATKGTTSPKAGAGGLKLTPRQEAVLAEQKKKKEKEQAAVQQHLQEEKERAEIARKKKRRRSRQPPTRNVSKGRRPPLRRWQEAEERACR